MAVYTFINGVRKRIFNHKPCIYINGIKHTIGKCYTFINGTRHLIFDTWSLKNEQLFLSDETITLPFGTYQFVLRGAGGAGGTNGTNGGLGGAGGKGEITSFNLTCNEATVVNINVGAGGLTYVNGGNGGYSDDTPASSSHGLNNLGGFGGGGGYPSYVKVGDTYYVANGGGGGGGGGASANYGRYGLGASGGGGGGYYRLDTSTGLIESVAGKLGARGGGQDDGYTRGMPGVDGNTTDFPNITSGRGGRGDASGLYGAGATGGGASGGGGCAGNGNHSSAYGGGAGGGAGGSEDAGGGAGGNGYANGVAGSNHHTTPTDTLAENQTYGINANYGIGGTNNVNGAQGCILVKRIA